MRNQRQSSRVNKLHGRKRLLVRTSDCQQLVISRAYCNDNAYNTHTQVDFNIKLHTIVNNPIIGCCDEVPTGVQGTERVWSQTLSTVPAQRCTDCEC